MGYDVYQWGGVWYHVIPEISINMKKEIVFKKHNNSLCRTSEQNMFDQQVYWHINTFLLYHSLFACFVTWKTCVKNIVHILSLILI